MAAKIDHLPQLGNPYIADSLLLGVLLDGQTLQNDRPEDRRIDIRFTLVSSEKLSLEGLQENLKQMREKTDTLIRKLKSCLFFALLKDSFAFTVKRKQFLDSSRRAIRSRY